MKVTFTARGHPNILATHRNTIEFTKDAEVSREGDCIIGVQANFSLEALRPLLRYKYLKILLEVEGLQEVVRAEVNSGFSNNREIVIRTTDFVSGRTLGIKADKAAKDLDRRLIKKLKEEGVLMKVELYGDNQEGL